MTLRRRPGEITSTAACVHAPGRRELLFLPWRAASRPNDSRRCRADVARSFLSWRCASGVAAYSPHTSQREAVLTTVYTVQRGAATLLLTVRYNIPSCNQPSLKLYSDRYHEATDIAFMHMASMLQSSSSVQSSHKRRLLDEHDESLPYGESKAASTLIAGLRGQAARRSSGM
eukprot:4656329-Pleurochrysis_carterae.AAC.3